MNPASIVTVHDWRLRLLLFIARRLGLTSQICAYHDSHRGAMVATNEETADEMIEYLFSDLALRQMIAHARTPPDLAVPQQQGVH